MTVDRETFLIAVALLASVLLAVLCPIPLLHWAVLLACGFVVALALLNVWTLGFVQPGQRVAEAAGRVPMFLTGGVAAAGLVTLLM
ncbi:hypothetical protein GCM10008956_31810 [Deinococcus arenae]|uniref:Uncharacterized protein n=1 Tax=Deinococcus arenae TaxID=1452751 RepID=A0A8H9GSJ8_9DEIO|nr:MULTISPECIES: hypothetical protein [Deinococcus]GGM53438.1 hypothetical protein GCM10008956_31810 [Deinococcus arenae]